MTNPYEIATAVVENGYHKGIHLYKVSEELLKLEEENDDLKTENEQMKEELEDLHNQLQVLCAEQDIF